MQIKFERRDENHFEEVLMLNKEVAMENDERIKESIKKPLLDFKDIFQIKILN